MRNFFCYLSISWLLTSGLAFAEPVNNIHQYKLDNGLQLIVKTDTRAPVVISEIWYRIGSSYEIPGTTGISHMLEHMMFKGTPAYPKDAFFKIIADNGGEQNAMTTQDYTMYYQELSNDKLALSFKLEADRMRHLTLDTTDFQHEMHVVQEERKMRIDNDPLMLTYERFNAAAFVENPYRNPTAGWASDLRQMTVNDLKAWYQNWYAPNNATVIVIGDVNPDKVYQLAQENFGSIKPSILPQLKKFPHKESVGTRNVVVKLPAKLPMLYMGYNVPSVVTQPNSYEPYALDVLSTVLGGNNSSRLQKNLVRGKRVAGDVGVYYTTYARLPTLFQIAAIPAEKTNVTQLQAAISKEIKQLMQTPISEQELNRVKTQVIANRIYAQDSIEYQGMILGGLYSVGLDYNEIDNYQKQIEALTPEQIQKTAQKYLTEESLTVGILDPQPIGNDTKQLPVDTNALRNSHVS